MFTTIKNWLYRSLSLLLEKVGLRRLRHCPVGTLSTITHDECGTSTKREKMKINLNDVTNIDSLTTINDNFDKIEQELQDRVLYRDNPVGEPNAMNSILDMNGYSIINVKDVYSEDGQWATMGALEAVQADVNQKAIQAAASASSAFDSKNYASLASDLTLDAYFEFSNQYLGAKASDPATDNNGNSLSPGSMYFKNTAPKNMRIYNGTSWQDVAGITSSTVTTVDPSNFANQVEAEEGINSSKLMTPERTKQAINKQVKEGFASSGAISVSVPASQPAHLVNLSQIESMIQAAGGPSQNGRLIRVHRYTDPSASNVFTKQAGDGKIEVFLVGAGGGGGRLGGGGGGAAWKTYEASALSANETVVVGAPDARTGIAGSGGGSGGNSTFKTTIAYGGKGKETTAIQGAGYDGGSFEGADYGVKGGIGGGGVAFGSNSDTSIDLVGNGGNSAIGTGGSPMQATVGLYKSRIDGAPNTGGGGSGYFGTDRMSAVGGSGYVEIRVYSA